MKFSLIFSKGERETERGSSALGKGLVACLLLMSVSCMLFVGTTMSWFTDQKTGTAGVITAGEFDVALYIDGTPVANGINPNTITMKRVDKESAYWEPGAVFTSPVMYVKNTGTLDLEYRLNLLTARETAADSGITDDNMRLLDVIEFRIVDAGTSLTDVILRNIFDNTTTDQRTPGAENDTPVAGADGVRALKAPTASPESPESPEAPESDKSKSGSFIIVGRMKEEAGNAYNAYNDYRNMSLTAPFTLVVTAQQSGFTWTDKRPIVCTEVLHEAWKAAAVPFVDNEHGFWKLNESGKHVYYCEVCETPLKTLDVEAAASKHADLAAEVNAGRTPDGVWTSTAADGTVYYYCRVCNTCIANVNSTT
ncbi:MAG: SipW-dependent-type signal peptide-containing protein [Oscillospiraceae bacterium]|nr:SipW-dependent-type signal peptide-containing protein [Oscillospiraceae bacterium]